MFILDCDLPQVVIGILSGIYKAILYLIPIAIVLFGVIDFLKAVMAQKDDGIKNNINLFIKRAITGLLVFFVFALINWIFGTIIGKVGGSSSAMSCAAQILGGKVNSNSNNNDNSSDDNSKEECYATQFSQCMTNNKSANKQEECKKSANSICGTNHN